MKESAQEMAEMGTQSKFGSNEGYLGTPTTDAD